MKWSAGLWKMSVMLGLSTAFASLLLLSIEVSAGKTPQKDPEIMTNFLTEADLNRWFVRMMWALGLAVAPVLLGQWLTVRAEKKNSAKPDIAALETTFKSELKAELKELTNAFREELDKIRSDMVTTSDVRNIARDEMEYRDKVRRPQ
jgi:hypothetical protein